MAARDWLAVYTFAVLEGSPDSAPVTRFFEDSMAVHAAAARALGFIGQAEPHEAVVRLPRFFDASRYSVVLHSLSWWTDFEAVRSFVGGSQHQAAVRHSAAYLVRGGWPTAALWWAQGVPTFNEAIARFEYLHDNGPSPWAFPLPRR